MDGSFWQSSAPVWLKAGVTAWAKYGGGSKGWSACEIKRVRTERGDAEVVFTKRPAKIMTGRKQEGFRAWDRLRPRNPALRGSDRPDLASPPRGE